ncbi:RHS repeat-associated core domain-containing protein [Pseudomonas sp. C2B4]|uniref:RHS repeat-associated core domain-containing protein n=1 Tax=Pseudomonas sp. C2B4 TaxID=2735270 RepID=UPI001586CB1E|nr:RHS repeat-associated core domain-containing protein [Pseudomonas sp. C2B4]NUU33936.1 RHS repeat-associated core domain-containing protein [Pseudomonas sp. C2B4]
MPSQSMNLLRSYRYDPLDRLVACATSTQASTQRFYLRDRLATEIQGTVQHSIMQHDDQLLAQQQRQGSAAPGTSLLATDRQRSVLTLLDAKRAHAFAYMPYGHCLAGSGLLSLLGFNGERPDSVTGWYLLGTGHHRPFNPVLGCFICPDSWSPFGAGGLNAYTYCKGDPVNQSDPTGHIGNPVKGLLNFLKLRTSSKTLAKRMAGTNRVNAWEHLVSPSPSKRSPAMQHKFEPSDIYSSVGANNSKESFSSDYASIQSYTSVNSSFAPPIPLRSPPASSRSASRFSVQNAERSPSGRQAGDIQEWINRIEASDSPSVGWPIVDYDPTHLATQHAGVHLSRHLRANLSLYNQGIHPISPEVLRISGYEKKMSRLRKQ